jgi:hypothetical protein
MSKITKCVAAVVTALTCAGLAYAPSATAATPYDHLTQQGRLLDETGAPIDGIQLTFTFTLYDAATSGNVLWTENQTITPDKGYFSAELGETTGLPDPSTTGTAFDGTHVLWLGIKIGTDTEMAPRQAVTSVPFALRAHEADHATSAASTPEAVHAANADNAAKAATATTATSATTATTANNVLSVTSDFVQATGSGTGSALAACPASNPIPIGGGCSAPSALSVATFSGGKSAAGYQCNTVSGTGTVNAIAACAK